MQQQASKQVSKEQQTIQTAMPECTVLGQQLTSLAEALGTALLGGAFDTGLLAFPTAAAGGPAPLAPRPAASGTPASAMTKPASWAISAAASFMAGPLFTAELVAAGAVVLLLVAAADTAAARLAAASAAAVAAGGLDGSPAGACR